jgi:hypothetical protein
MKELGLIQRYLGVEFSHSRDSISIHQAQYAAKILANTGLKNCCPLAVPLPTGTSLSDHEDSPLFDQFQYCHTVGQLLYLTNTRPDLSYSVNYVSQFMTRPLECHWHAVQHILQYLHGTLHFGIVYRLQVLLLTGTLATSAPIRLDAYSDADWAACKASRRSTGGHVFKLAGGAITYSSK